MSEYSIGIEDHYAWANLVSVTTSGPNEILLDRRRVELLDQQLPASPYHHETLQMPLSEAEKLVRDVKTSANKRAKSALSSLIGELAPAKCRGIVSIKSPTVSMVASPWIPTTPALISSVACVPDDHHAEQLAVLASRRSTLTKPVRSPYIAARAIAAYGNVPT